MGCKPSRSRPGKRSQFPTGGKGRGAKEQWPVASERKAGEIVPHGSPPTPLAPVTLGANRASRPQRRWPRYVFDLEGSVNSAFLGLFSATFGPSSQAMDTQLNALPTLPVLARTVSGCLNSAFLGLF